MDDYRESISCVALAGGQGRRMRGEDKGLLRLHDRPMIGYVVGKLAGQGSEVLINANRNMDEYAGMGCRVISDRLQGYAGPLAGMASAMYASATPYLLTAPCDSPFIADDLAGRLYDALRAEQASIAVANDGKRLQPVFCLLRTELLDSVEAYLGEGKHKIDGWLEREGYVSVDFSDRPDMFINVNTPEDVVLAERKLAAEGRVGNDEL